MAYQPPSTVEAGVFELSPGDLIMLPGDLLGRVEGFATFTLDPGSVVLAVLTAWGLQHVALRYNDVVTVLCGA